MVLPVYARPAHLRRVLACLRAERVPLIAAFADGAKTPADGERVAEVRAMLRAIDWCEVRVTERESNLGLGRNVLAAVSEIAAAYPTFLVWEDDLVCMPGAFAWLSAALRHYVDDRRVMSVTGWTHPEICPADVEAAAAPYFDGRAECWVWGGYARSWQGMESTALEKVAALRAGGISPDAYGADLPRMARIESRRNIWAVRWLLHHLEQGGLCLRPPWSMVEHIGFDELATNSIAAERWANPSLRPAPPIPASWPEAVENSECRALWRKANPPESVVTRLRAKVRARARRWSSRVRTVARAMVPEGVRSRVRQRFGWKWFRGDYGTWAEARAASGGYEAGSILDRVLTAALQVKAGQAAFERDSVLFAEPEPDAPLLAALEAVRQSIDGPLRVLDFGGSLGSTYWRLRAHMPPEAILAWDVVEQPSFVTAGRRHLREGPLDFHFTMSEATAARAHDVLLCATALQYLEHPERALAEWRELPIPFLLLSNLPLHTTGPTRLRVQHVPPSIYSASYPVRFFNRAEFIAGLEPHFDIVRAFASEAVWPVEDGWYPSSGLLLRRKRNE